MRTTVRRQCNSVQVHVINNNAVDELEELVKPYVDQDDLTYNAMELVKVILKNYELVNLAIIVDDYNKRNG
jgi:hypothetical protein